LSRFASNFFFIIAICRTSFWLPVGAPQNLKLQT